MDSSVKNPFDLPPPVDLLTYSTGPVTGVLLQEGDDLSLLGGGAAAADHSRTLARQLHKLVLIVAQTHLHRKTTNIISVSIGNYSETPPYLFWLKEIFSVGTHVLGSSTAPAIERGSVQGVFAASAIPLRSLPR